MQHTTNPQKAHQGKAVVIVSSDRASQGIYPDRSGPLAVSWLEERGYEVEDHKVIPDLEEHLLTALENAHVEEISLVIVSGGTGIGTKDRTPQVVARYADYEIPGFGEIMRRKSEHFSPTSYLSRCGAWVIGSQLLIAVPGSPNGTIENLTILEDLIPAALEALKDRCHHPYAKGNL